jgi:PAS domain S-box-containing protein
LFGFWGLRKGGEIFPKDVYLYKGTYFGKDVIVAVGADITERKRAEEALEESEKKFRTLFESMAPGVFYQRSNGILIDANPAALSMFGLTREQFMGRDSYDPRWKVVSESGELLPAEQHPSMIALRSGKMVRDLVIGVYNPKQDVMRWLSTNAEPQFRSGDTTPYQVFVTMYDITERKKAEEALLQANKKLNLLSSITRHDINNKMTVLQGYLNILKKKQLDPTLNEYCDKAATAAQCISSMIQFTKEYEKIGINAPVWQEVRTVLDTATKLAPPGQVMMKNDLPAGMEVFADPLIGKVFYNIMDNAVRYGGKITTIRFSAEEAGDDHVIICEDDGDGVVAEEKEKIFERGFGKNTGLGLALSREILDITGITIKETGEPGKGARFEMMVPKGAWRRAGEDN